MNGGETRHPLPWREAARRAGQAGAYRRSLIVAAIVGTALNIINQGDVMMVSLIGLNWFKIGLTYCVPFLVASYGAISAIRNR